MKELEILIMIITIIFVVSAGIIVWIFSVNVLIDFVIYMKKKLQKIRERIGLK